PESRSVVALKPAMSSCSKAARRFSAMGVSSPSSVRLKYAPTHLGMCATSSLERTPDILLVFVAEDRAPRRGNEKTFPPGNQLVVRSRRRAAARAFEFTGALHCACPRNRALTSSPDTPTPRSLAPLRQQVAVGGVSAMPRAIRREPRGFDEQWAANAAEIER